MVLRGSRSGAGSIRARNPYNRGDRTKREQIAPQWARWVTTFRNFLVQLITEEEVEGQGPSVIFYVPMSHNGVRFAFDFTALSPDELDAVEGLLKSCIDLARPIVKHRDGKAKQDAADGYDSNPRVYRPLPTVVERAWARGLDGQSLLNRRTGFLPRDAADVVTDHRAGDYGSLVAQSDEEAHAGVESAGSGC